MIFYGGPFSVAINARRAASSEYIEIIETNVYEQEGNKGDGSDTTCKASKVPRKWHSAGEKEKEMQC